MKKRLLSLLFVITLFSASAVSASALTNNILKVGIRWGSTALEAANLENAVGSGYEFGYYDESRHFVYLDETDETTITMRVTGSRNGVVVTEVCCFGLMKAAIALVSVPRGGTQRHGARAINIPAGLSTAAMTTAH